MSPRNPWTTVTHGQTDRQTDGRVSTMQPHRAYLYLSAAGMLRLAGR